MTSARGRSFLREKATTSPYMKGFYHTCGTYWRTTQYDGDYVCFGTRWVYSGPASYGCRGRCGTGCGYYYYSQYTLDCLDHDSCVRDVYYSSCGDEAQVATDDIFFARAQCARY